MIEVLLRVAGGLLLLLAGVNLLLPGRYGWRGELQRVELLTRQVFWSHMFFIVLAVAGMGCLCLFYATQLLKPGVLQRGLLLFLSLFWGLKLLAQLLYFDLQLWRGKRFETAVHAGLTGLWLYLTGVFAAAWYVNLTGGEA